MDNFLIITGVILLTARLAGSVLQWLPGLFLSYLALPAMQLTDIYQFTTRF